MKMVGCVKIMGLVEHVRHFESTEDFKANNINIHTGFKFKQDLKAKTKRKLLE